MRLEIENLESTFEDHYLTSIYMSTKLNKELILPELSFKIIGLAFEVFNEIGPGHREEVYQKAMERQFELNKMTYQKELYHPVIFKNKKIKKRFFDFLVEKEVVVEIKRYDYFSPGHFEQLNSYLRMTGLRLGLLISFTNYGVRFRRVVNLPTESKPQP